MRKIKDLPEPNICHSPDHNPPTMIVLPPGVYEHECSACGKKQVVVIPHGPRC